jgi:hypothetical protein
MDNPPITMGNPPTTTDNPPTTTTNDPTSTMASTAPSPPTSFPHFRHLPLELRLSIWELCLPSRFIPLSALILAHKNHSHQPRRYHALAAVTTLLRALLARPGRISQVCRESRAAATARRQPVDALGLQWLSGPGTGDGWFDPRTDTVLLDCDVFRRYAAIWSELQKALGMTHTAASGSGVERGCVRVGLGGELVDWCKRHSDVSGDEIGIRQQTWPVVVDKIWLSVKGDPACLDGRFGVFGEECGILVELGDETRLNWMDENPAMYSYTGLDTPRLMRRAMKQWKDIEDKVRPLSREVGFVGTEKEWRTPSFGPYPVIKVELMGAVGACY